MFVSTLGLKPPVSLAAHARHGNDSRLPKTRLPMLGVSIGKHSRLLGREEPGKEGREITRSVSLRKITRLLATEMGIDTADLS